MLIREHERHFMSVGAERNEVDFGTESGPRGPLRYRRSERALVESRERGP
jgi:hypothetical protein